MERHSAASTDLEKSAPGKSKVLSDGFLGESAFSEVGSVFWK